MMHPPALARRILMLVENLPSPFDRRVWQEATTLQENGYQVSIICPTGKGHEARHEILDGIHIYRYRLHLEASGPLGYLLEYAQALFCTAVLTWRVWFTRGFDVIHACNPPDLLFLIGGFFKLTMGTKFVFDHHDINPELYEAKFARKDVFYRWLLRCERWTFRTADLSIATNDSYRRIAVERGGMTPAAVYVVRSGPRLDRMRRMVPSAPLRCGRRFLVGYVGVMGDQEGIDLLLLAVQHIVLKLHRTDIQFGLVGGGTALTAMQALAQDLGIAAYVTVTGRVPDAEMLAMLNPADVCVTPDVANAMNDMSTMNKIMEYMALAKPIVQFDLIEGRVSAQDASLYALRNDPVDFACRIIALLDDPRRRRRMGQAGRRRVERELEWKYEAPKLLRAYADLFDAVPAVGAVRQREV